MARLKQFYSTAPKKPCVSNQGPKTTSQVTCSRLSPKLTLALALVSPSVDLEEAQDVIRGTPGPLSTPPVEAEAQVVIHIEMVVVVAEIPTAVTVEQEVVSLEEVILTLPRPPRL